MLDRFLSVITDGGLLHRAEKSEKSEHTISIVEDVTSHVEVLAYGSNAAAHYGEILADLKRKGTMIGG